jgi:cell division protein FtsI (penicillin-binding protein 3)
VASFLGFTPVENTEVAVLVIIDEPKKNYYGGVVAAPAFKTIAHETLNYLNVPPRNRLWGKKRRLTVLKGPEAAG